MGHKIGDAVRLKPGSELRDLLDPWDEATGRVTAVFDHLDPPRLNILYGEEGPAAFGLAATEFVPDRPLSAAPF